MQVSAELERQWPSSDASVDSSVDSSSDASVGAVDNNPFAETGDRCEEGEGEWHPRAPSGDGATCPITLCAFEARRGVRRAYLRANGDPQPHGAQRHVFPHGEAGPSTICSATGLSYANRRGREGSTRAGLAPRSEAIFFRPPIQYGEMKAPLLSPPSPSAPLLSRVTALLLATRDPIACVPPAWPHPALIILPGTQNARDLLIDDLDIRTATWPPSGGEGGLVHRGFARRTRALMSRVWEFVDAHDEFVVAGHSMGGSCAVLSACLMHEMPKRVRGVYTFGMPRMASPEFRRYYERTGLAGVSRHFTTPRDPVVFRIPNWYAPAGEYETVACDSDDLWTHHDMRSYRAALADN